MGNNLRKLRMARDWTHEQAAEALGVSRSQFIKLERGERQLTADYIRRAAEAFNVLEKDVFSNTLTAPLVGYVAAGSEAHFFDAQGPFEEVPMPENGTENTVAVEARGDSLGPFFNRWLVYYDELRTPPTSDLIGQLCVVQLLDGRTLVKKLMRGSHPDLYHLLSQTESPIEDVELEWAARVTSMAPR